MAAERSESPAFAGMRDYAVRAIPLASAGADLRIADHGRQCRIALPAECRSGHGSGIYGAGLALDAARSPTRHCRRHTPMVTTKNPMQHMLNTARPRSTSTSGTTQGRSRLSGRLDLVHRCDVRRWRHAERATACSCRTPRPRCVSETTSGWSRTIRLPTPASTSGDM